MAHSQIAQDIWASGIAEFAATTAALNAGAMHRAGLLNHVEIGAMHVFLGVLEGAAQTEDQHSIVRSLRQCLPPDL